MVTLNCLNYNTKHVRDHYPRFCKYFQNFLTSHTSLDFSQYKPRYVGRNSFRKLILITKVKKISNKPSSLKIIFLDDESNSKHFRMFPRAI